MTNRMREILILNIIQLVYYKSVIKNIDLYRKITFKTQKHAIFYHQKCVFVMQMHAYCLI